MGIHLSKRLEKRKYELFVLLKFFITDRLLRLLIGMVYMNKLLTGIFIILVGAVYLSGCIGTDTIEGKKLDVIVTSPTNPESMGSNESDIHYSFEEEIAMLQDKTNRTIPEELKIGQTTQISLKENPTTGYSWNVTVTDGLVIIDDTFVGPDNKRLVGAGGTHIWTLKATGVGNQSFSGVYRRSWEPADDSDTRYVKEFIVLQ